MGRPQPGLLLRCAGPRHERRREGRLKERRVGLDFALVPGLLLLVARDLALYDAPRVLGWRLTHDAEVASLVRSLGPLLPAATGALDRDPVALLLAALAVLCGFVYGLLAAASASVRSRAVVIALAAALVVVLPSVAFISLGAATGRPYGQDGGVVQLPLATHKILSGESPYGADYSDTILAKQARVSSFWGARGGNPILHHHAYLPGTHLVMLPFQLACERAFGFFDPRLVTLLGYLLVIVLASRLPRSPEARLSAAAVAALNPLVYWHQIFGANDLLFVAMLLGTVLLLRARPSLAAALLGFACATKQLAWPYAPFLLVALSGASSFRELVSLACLRRLRRPLLVMATVGLAVVLPVAALDLRRFWGDIFVYNAGLPGGDNYPLGGTPGFGFANFLIYFGRVAKLSDYFPFTRFYALVAPLGLLLVRAQFRANDAAQALLTGSAALTLTLYFSRVVHPNYLIPAAVLLPLALLVRGRRPGLALAPLLLFALAVEIAEQQLFRTTWEQASAAGLPARLGGLVASLAPRAGLQLSHDPLGLLFSALAAGLGVVWLTLGAVTSTDEPWSAGAGHRFARLWSGARATLLASTFLLVVVAPTLVLVAVGDRTGLVRAQDPAVVQAQADGRRLAAGRSPYAPPFDATPPGREAVSASFRLDPPAAIEPDHPLLPPGPSVVAALSRLIGLADLRLACLLALAALAFSLARASSSARAVGGKLAPLAAGALVPLSLLVAPLALGVVLGSPLPVALLAVVLSWLAARRGRGVAAGVWAGLAAACHHRAGLAAVALLWASFSPGSSDERTAASARRSRIRALAAALASYALVVVPVMLLDAPAFVSRLRAAAVPGAGLGAFDLLAYRGVEGSAFGLGLAAAAPLLALALTAALLRLRAPAPALAALASLGALVLAPAVSPEAVALPILLAALAVSVGHETGDGAVTTVDTSG